MRDKGIFASETPAEHKATGLLAMLQFETAQDFLRDHADELVGDMWDRARKAIPDYLKAEEQAEGKMGKEARLLSGVLGMGAMLFAVAVKLGDEAPPRIRRFAPIAQIVYEDYIARGGKPYTEEQLQGARTAARAKREANRAGLPCPDCGTVHPVDDYVAPPDAN